MEGKFPTSYISGDSHFQALLQSVYDSALITDLAGRIVDVNVRAIEKLLLSREQLCSMSVLNIISGSDDSLISTLYNNLENDRFTIIQASCIRGDGSLFSAEISVNKLNLGEVHLCFLLRDITLRIQREEMLRTTYNAIQNSGDGIAVANVDAKLEYVNPALAKMWGYTSPEDMQGMDIHTLLMNRSVTDRMMARIMTEQNNLVFDAVAVRQDGSEFEVQVSLAGNVNTEGENVGMIFSFVDISDRKRAENAERKAEQRRVMLESLGAACHHLGQPATVLLGNLGIIQKKMGAEDTVLNDLIQSSIEAMETMSNILYKLNTVNEYKTTQYLEKPAGDDSEESRILEI